MVKIVLAGSNLGVPMKFMAMIVFAILLASCQQSADATKSQPIKLAASTYSDLIVVEQTWDYTEQMNLDYALALEFPPNTAVGTIKKVLEDPNTGHLYVLENDAKEGIFIFDAEGQYLNAFAKEGEGPGEALQILDFCFNEDRILVASTLKVMLFNTAGNLLIEKAKNDFAKNIVFGNIRSVSAYKQGYLLRFDATPSESGTYDVCYIDAELNFKKGFHKPDLRTRLIPFGSSHMAVNDKDQVAVLDVFGFRLELFNTDLELEKEYLGWHSPIDFEEVAKKSNPQNINTVLPFIEQSHMPRDFYHWQGKFIAKTVNMQTKRIRFVIVDPLQKQFKSFPGYNAETQTAVDQILSKANSISKQRMAAVIYDCQDWIAFRQAYPDLPLIGNQKAECPDLVFVNWKPEAFD
jgi:hypothetical protein